MNISTTKFTIHTAKGNQEFGEFDFQKRPSEEDAFITLKSAPFEGWHTAFSIEAHSAGADSELIMLAVGNHVQTANGLVFCVKRLRVTAFEDFSD